MWTYGKQEKYEAILHNNYIQLNSISTKHLLSPSISQVICESTGRESDKVSAFKELMMNKSQAYRKIRFKQTGFLNSLSVNLIWLNDFGEIDLQQIDLLPMRATNFGMS